MKIIYKSLMTIAFAGLSLASCDKELKEETAMEVGVVTDNNVSFNGNTVTVKKGSPVTFSFNGDPDFITFFSGEIGHEYKHRNRTEMKVEDIEKCELSFRIWYRYGNASTIKGSTHVLVSDQFNGINGSNVDQDKQTVENCEWTEVFAQEELPTKPNSTSETAESSKTFTFELSSYLAKEITIAVHYNPIDNSNTMPQLNIMDMNIDLMFTNGKGNTVNAKDFGFSPLNLVYDLTKLNDSHKKVLKKALGNEKMPDEDLNSEENIKKYPYLLVDGQIPDFWSTTTPTRIQIAGGSKGTTKADTWLISAPVLLGTCYPDAGQSIKNISQSLEIYSHTYEEAGTYTATFVANNANYVHQGGQVIRELTINVVE